jgi:cell division protein FtsZ
MNATPDSCPAGPALRRIKIIGVGTAGTLMVDQLNRADFGAASFAFVNTDSSAPVGPSKQLLLDTTPVRGLGTGGDPERGRKLAEEHFESLKSLCAETDVVFLVTGLGGGAGSGVTPALARAAKEAGALVLAFVTLPFDCEGNRRARQAQAALTELASVCDGALCLPNQKAFHLLPGNATFVETFQHTTRLLAEGLGGVWRLLMHRGLIEIHFDDLRAVLCEHGGESCFASLEAAGPARGEEVMSRLTTHPLLDGGKALETAPSVLVSILGGPDLSMTEVNRVMQEVNQRCPGARVVMGAAVAETHRERLAVTIIATRPRVFESASLATHSAAPAEEAETVSGFGAELLHPTEVARPRTRVVPPAPSLNAEQRAEIIAKHGGKSARGRKNPSGPRMRQTTLPLDIVNKGRFDKSEPTIHKGEDLDLPTYVRRGIALN